MTKSGLNMGAPSNLIAHVAFVGLPGSGKSTVGRQLARRLGRPFVDTDHLIEKRIGLSIREFFEREGEEPFRDLEQAVIDEVTGGEPCVLSTGGGAVLRQANREHLKRRSHAIYLHSSPEDVFRRLRHDQNRPLLQVADPLARLRDLYAVRDPLYRESARLVVETGRPSVPALVHLIADQLQAAGLLPAAPD
ncbi:MAG: shikimate kinase [Pseudomonadota bacterium]